MTNSNVRYVLISMLHIFSFVLHADYGDTDCNGDQILAFHDLDNVISSITDISSGTPTITSATYTEAGTGAAIQFKAAAVHPSGCATTATDCVYVMYASNSVTYLGTLDTANNQVIQIGPLGSLPLTAMSFDCAGNLRAIHSQDLSTYLIDTSTGAATLDPSATGGTSCKDYYDCIEVMAFNAYDGQFWRVSSSSGTNSAIPKLCQGIDAATETCVDITDPANLCTSTGSENVIDISAMSYIGGGGAGTPGWMLISCAQIGVTRAVLLDLSNGEISDIGYGTEEIDVGDNRMSGLVNLDASGTAYCSAAASLACVITPSPTTPAPTTPSPVTPLPSTPGVTVTMIIIEELDSDEVIDGDSSDDDSDDLSDATDDDDDDDFDIFEVCKDAFDELEDMIESSDDDSTEAGDTLLAYCSGLTCVIEEVCITDAAMDQIEAGTLSECSCAILECNANCDLFSNDGYVRATFIGFTLVISNLLWI